MKTIIPPIKSQGIKTKLVPWIKEISNFSASASWVEPFMGTGVVGFNLAPQKAILCDTNPHLINFYSAVANKEITPEKVRAFLSFEGSQLLEKGEAHYYHIRDRFNSGGDPFDFLFLNRACFNGMMRFNRKGYFNVPFCKKPNRFCQSYVTKITNQVSKISKILSLKNFIFRQQDFKATIQDAKASDILYCDPPYIDRHVDYYNGWSITQEKELYNALVHFKGRFILSTWHSNQYRKNEHIENMWHNFNIYTKEHFYHVGGSEKNRNPMTEALITNFIPPSLTSLEETGYTQPFLANVA